MSKWLVVLGSRISSSFAELKGYYKHVTNAVTTWFPGFLILPSFAQRGGKVSDLWNEVDAVTVGINTCFCICFSHLWRNLMMRISNQIIWHENGIQIKSTMIFVLVLVALNCYRCRSSLLRNGIAVYELCFFPVNVQINCQERIRWICHGLRRQRIFSLSLSTESFSWWKWIKIKIKNPGNQTPCHSSFVGRDHLRSTSEIIRDSGSFAVQFGDHFWSGDHLRSGIICGAVHYCRFHQRFRAF